MYPQTTNISPSTSASKPKSVSETNPTGKQSTESSPQSSLPCGQRTPTALTSSLNAPSSHTPPQPFVHTQHNLQNPIDNKLDTHLLKLLTNLPSRTFQVKNNAYQNPQMAAR